MSIKLYEAVAQLETVNAWIDEHADDILAAGGQMSPELEALLNEAEGTFKEKVERTALKVRELEAEADAVKVEVDRLTQRAKTATNAAASLKAYLMRCLTDANETTVKGTLVTVAIQQNPPKVDGDIPRETLEEWYHQSKGQNPFVTVVPEQFTVNKKAVLAAAKEGKDIPAGLAVSRSASLRIR
jgi:hypothetical protein